MLGCRTPFEETLLLRHANRSRNNVLHLSVFARFDAAEEPDDNAVRAGDIQTSGVFFRVSGEASMPGFDEYHPPGLGHF